MGQKYFIIAIAFSLFLSACSKDEDTNDEEIPVVDNTPNSFTYSGEHSGTYKISGITEDDKGNSLANIKIDFNLFEDGGNYQSIIGPITIKSNEKGEYSFLGLPNPDQFETLNISMNSITLEAYDASNSRKYERCYNWPSMVYNGTFPANEIIKKLKLLEVNANTVLKGTVKYADGTPVPANQLGLIDVSYGSTGAYQSYAFTFNQFTQTNYTDEATGSYYDETTGEFKFTNCLMGGNHNYALHVNHIDLETYSSWDSHITINEGVENEVNVTIVEN